jgi:hypothetical protein
VSQHDDIAAAAEHYLVVEITGGPDDADEDDAEPVPTRRPGVRSRQEQRGQG